MGLAGFITALAASALSLVISFIPVQFTNILLSLFLVFLSIMCRVIPTRTSLKACLASCAVLTFIFRFSYMTLIGKLLYAVLMIAVVVGAVLMHMGTNQYIVKGGEKE